MVKKFIEGYCWLLNQLTAISLAIMVVLVFGNVVMRYGFNSGITVSEELSRWLFVWVTFMGAVVALHEKAHLGTDMLVGRLGATGKKVCMALSLVLMLYCLWLVFKGSYDQYLVNKDSTSPVMEVSMGIFYASGLVFAVLGAPIVLMDLWRLLSGQVDDAHLVLIQESEEAPHGGDSGPHSRA